MASCTCADPAAVAKAINEQTSTVSGKLETANKNSEAIHETMYGKAMEGNPGAPAPVRFCHWAAPEYGATGESGWSTAFRVAAIAIAIANGIAQAEISDKQMDLAEGYYEQAKYKWDRFSEKYMPLEKQLLLEVSNEPIRELDCDGAKSRATNAVNTAYDGMTVYLARQAKKLRLCIDPSLLSVLDHKQSVTLVDTENYNLTDEQWFTDYKNDQRWNRRSAVLNLGRNLSSEALRYGEIARQLYSQVGAQLDRAASGVMTALGYYGARNDTYYPTTYLSGQGTQLVQIGTVSTTNPSASSSGVNPS